MTRALIAIGISSAPPLPRLDGAVSDAHAIAAWAMSAGYEEVRVFTDENGTPVKVNSLYDCCNELIAKPELEQLIIYFAGHGYAPYPGHETWLLSKWKTESNEAINASATLQYALGYKRPRISIIADACRTTRSTNAPRIGSIILPPPGDDAVLPQVDQFLATPFGFAAQEISTPESSYGVFSREIRLALAGAAAIGRGENRVVTSGSLKEYLDDAVPAALEGVAGAEIQFPDTNARWKAPKDVYAVLPDEPNEPVQALQYTLQDWTGPSNVPIPQIDSVAVSEAKAARQDAIAFDANKYLLAEGRQSFDTRMGVTVVGARVDHVVTSAGQSEMFVDFDEQQVRISSDRPVTALLRLVHPQWTGYWAPVAVYPGLIATIVVDDGGASSLNYRPSLNSRPNRMLEPDTPQIEAVLAEVSSMLRHSAMPARKRIDEMVEFLRFRKDANPALAVVAAHVCHRIGDLASIRDMENHGIGMGLYTPFDLLLLSGKAAPNPGRLVVGTFPFMSRGWGLLGTAKFDVDQRLRAVSDGIGPSLWTMVEPKVADTLAALIVESPAAFARV